MNTQTPRDDFSDLDDFHSASFNSGLALGQTPKNAAAPVAVGAGDEPCSKCKGSGKFTFGYTYTRVQDCYTCKGTGRVKAGYVKRAAAKAKGDRTKAQNLAAKVEAFQQQYPAVYADLEQGRTDFTRSLFDKLRTYGSLTENQIAAVQRGIDARAARKAEAQAAAPAVQGTNQVVEALTKATRTGHKAPKIRTRVAEFSLAKPTSVNAGCVYVKAGETYLGKITPEGRFLASREATQEQAAAVVAVFSNALAEAVEYGRETGRCSCCGRELTDPESIARGIGPICADGFF